MNIKKTTAAVIVAGLTVAGSSYAWANEIFFTPTEEKQQQTNVETVLESNLKDLITPETTDELNENSTTTDNNTHSETSSENSTIENSEFITDENSQDDEAVDSSSSPIQSTERLNEFPEIPEGYTAGNLIALKQAYINAGNETAKAAILRNALRSISKYEAKNSTNNNENVPAVKVELELVDVIKPAVKVNLELVDTISSDEITKETTTKPSTTQLQNTETKEETIPTLKETQKNQKSTKDHEKAARKTTKEKQKEERKTLKEQQKAEKQALKAEQKAEKQNSKNNKE